MCMRSPAGIEKIQSRIGNGAHFVYWGAALAQWGIGPSCNRRVVGSIPALPISCKSKCP